MRRRRRYSLHLSLKTDSFLECNKSSVTTNNDLLLNDKFYQCIREEFPSCSAEFSAHTTNNYNSYKSIHEEALKIKKLLMNNCKADVSENIKRIPTKNRTCVSRSVNFTTKCSFINILRLQTTFIQFIIFTSIFLMAFTNISIVHARVIDSLNTNAHSKDNIQYINNEYHNRHRREEVDVDSRKPKISIIDSAKKNDGIEDVIVRTSLGKIRGFKQASLHKISTITKNFVFRCLKIKL